MKLLLFASVSPWRRRAWALAAVSGLVACSAGSAHSPSVRLGFAPMAEAVAAPAVRLGLEGIEESAAHDIPPPPPSPPAAPGRQQPVAASAQSDPQATGVRTTSLRSIEAAARPPAASPTPAPPRPREIAAP